MAIKGGKPGQRGGEQGARRDALPPLEFDEDGKIIWPPAIHKLQRNVRENWEKIIRALVGGPIIDPGGKATAELMAIAGVEKSNSSVVSDLLKLEVWGLVKRDFVNPRTGVPSARRTYKIELDVPVEQLPDVLLPMGKHERLLNAMPDVEPERAEPPSFSTDIEELTPIGEPPTAGQHHPSAVAVALALLDAVVAKANEPTIGQEQLDNLVERLTRAQEQVNVLIAERDEARKDRITMLESRRDLRKRYEALQEEHQKLERNYQVALRAANTAATNGSVSDQTRREIERLARKIPT